MADAFPVVAMQGWLGKRARTATLVRWRRKALIGQYDYFNWSGNVDLFPHGRHKTQYSPLASLIA